MQAVRQNSCATTTMKSRNSAQRVLIDSCQMYVVMYANCSCTRRLVSGIANVIADEQDEPER